MDSVNRIVPQLISRGRYVRPVLGIEMDDRYNAMINRQYDVQGVVVLAVTPGSGAAKAGLTGIRQQANSIILGDVIQKINGRNVQTVDDLADVLDESEVGDQVVLTIYRGNRQHTLNVTLTSPDDYR